MIIKTPRLILREFETTDIAAIHKIAKTKGFVFYSLDHKQETARDFVLRAISLARDFDTRQSFKMAVECKDRQRQNSADTCIGYVSVDDIDGKVSGTPDIGYLIDPRYQGRGFATEAATGLMRAVFNKFAHVDDMWLTVHPDNHASRHVAEKLSFNRTGHKTIETRHGTEPRLIYKTNRRNFAATCSPQAIAI